MKHLFYFSALVILLGSCTDYKSHCPKDEMYHEHLFTYSSMYTSIELGYDGWMSEICKKCGLRRKFNNDLRYKKHYGSVNLYMNPASNKYSDLCVVYEENGVYHYKNISKYDLELVTDAEPVDSDYIEIIDSI